VRVPWLGEVLAAAGLEVVTVGDPIGRGRDMAAVYGVVGHDTVTTAAWSDEAVDRLLRDGRPDLAGPLAQLGLDRHGRFRWVADGRCNHNGYGRIWGNNAIGIEVYCAGGLAGREEPWNAAQREAFVIGARAILDHLRLGPSEFFNPRVAGHKETDPARKVDPHKVDMDQVRRDIAGRELQQEVPAVATKRIAGRDRYQTAVKICRTRFTPDEVSTVYVMLDGSPDGQVAPLLGAPVLLVETDHVPGPTAWALQHFRPDEVVAIGGTAAVPDAILRRCAELAAER
jgi:hypothetical protein